MLKQPMETLDELASVATQLQHDIFTGVVAIHGDGASQADRDAATEAALDRLDKAVRAVGIAARQFLRASESPAESWTSEGGGEEGATSVVADIVASAARRGEAAATHALRALLSLASNGADSVDDAVSILALSLSLITSLSVVTAAAADALGSVAGVPTDEARRRLALAAVEAAREARTDEAGEGPYVTALAAAAASLLDAHAGRSPSHQEELDAGFDEIEQLMDGL